jgi:hypothetical protein
MYFFGTATYTYTILVHMWDAIMVHTCGTTPWYTMIASSIMYAIQDGWIALTNGINSEGNAPDKHINGERRKI